MRQLSIFWVRAICQNNFFYLFQNLFLICCITLNFLLSHSTFWEEELLGICQEVFARERERRIKLFLDSHFGNYLNWFYTKKPLMWKSLDIGWNRWAVLHRRRSGGWQGWVEVDLLGRRRRHKSRPMNSEWGLSSPPNGHIWREITTKFNLALYHLFPSFIHSITNFFGSNL